MDQGGVKHCQRGTLKQRGHSKKIRATRLLQLFSACVTKCTARRLPLLAGRSDAVPDNQIGADQDLDRMLPFAGLDEFVE